MSKYIDIYPDTIIGSGLVSQISNLTGCPWGDFTPLQIQSIEILYAVRSSQKPLISLFPEIAPESRAPFVLAMYKDKWQKYWDNFAITYQPLSPYLVTENGTEDREIDRLDTTTYGRVIDTTGSDTGTVKNDGESSNNNHNNVFGFNSTMPVPSDTNTGTDTSTDTQTRNLTATGKTTNSGSDTLGRSDTDNMEYSRTKSGNLGYQSAQDLLMAEFELWKETFFEYVFRDIDRLITLAIY